MFGVRGNFTGKVAFSCKLKLLRIWPIYSVFTYIGVGILYHPIGVIHRYDDTKCQHFICYGHKSIGKYVLKFTKFSVSFAFLRN